MIKKKKKQDATCTATRIIFYTYMCTERSAAASEYRTRNPAITNSMRYCYTNFVCIISFFACFAQLRHLTTIGTHIFAMRFFEEIRVKVSFYFDYDVIIRLPT